jgi:hypothetical protein
MSLELALIYSAPSHQAPCEGKLIKNSSGKSGAGKMFSVTPHYECGSRGGGEEEKRNAEKRH